MKSSIFAGVSAVVVLAATADVAGAPTIDNVTQVTSHVTLQDALNNAANGDAIVIGAGTLAEDNIDFPVGVDVTITGAGSGLTFIDGGGAANPDNPILDMRNTAQTRDTVISGLTLINGTRTTDSSGRGALWIVGATSPVFIDVRFLNSSGSGASGAAHMEIVSATSAPRFERCEFRGGFDAFSDMIVRGPAEFVQCLMIGSSQTQAVAVRDTASPLFVNTTVVHPNRAFLLRETAQVSIVNTVLEGTVLTLDSGIINADRSLFSGATGNNIDGVATFVDAVGGDYRLATGSLGIDMGDETAYSAAGGSVGDLDSNLRLRDDPSTADTGTGIVSYLDAGPYEYQSAPCDGDANGDTVIDVNDISYVLFRLGNLCP